ncbi:MAG TPA: NAD(P)-dependent oxidoreductase [Beijerinckiaceae bacterium]|jgi:phosphonate dehydrogenase
MNMHAAGVAKPRLLVTNRLHDEVRDALAMRFDVAMNAADEPWPAEELRARAARCDAMMAFMTDHVDEAFLAACPALRMIACALKGDDNIDAAACARRGVKVSIVPDLLTAPTAELAIGLMIALGRRMLEGDALVRAGAFRGWRPKLYGMGLDGSRVGLLGMGAVGRALAHRLRAFRCDLVYDDPRPLAPHEEDALGLRRMRREALLAQSDYVVLASPLTPATLRMIDAHALDRMAPGALLVNPARGSLVDEAAVADALESGRLGGYAADVFAFEDHARADRPDAVDPRLRAHPRTVFTPHIGSAVAQARLAIEHAAARSLLDFFADAAEGRAAMEARA